MFQWKENGEKHIQLCNQTTNQTSIDDVGEKPRKADQREAASGEI